MEDQSKGTDPGSDETASGALALPPSSAHVRPMQEHSIKLRGGWEWHGKDSAEPRRMTLPLPGFPENAGRVRLVRSFQTPPLDPRCETLWLRLNSVPGLVALSLNDREIARPSAVDDAGRLYCLQGVLPARNRLVLEVEVVEPWEGRVRHSKWGEVALVIRRSAEPD
ncbi:MAG: hypothetical protein NVSMB9_02110 [Isosphaeraceae bacterium]